MKPSVILVIIVVAAMSGCLGEAEDSRFSGGSIDATRVANTTGVPLHDVTRRELAQNEDVLEAVEEAYENGTSGHDLTESEVDAAGRFIRGYEAYDPDEHRPGQPGGTYFVYRNRTIAVSIVRLT